MRSHLSKKSTLKLVDGLFTSKVRYGLQLYGLVRSNSLDPVNQDLKAIQLVQNKLLRSLNGTKISDKVSTASLLEKFNMLSINQLNANAKLLEIWKALNIMKYPLQIKQQSTAHTGATTRADSQQRPCEIGRSTLTKKTCISDAIKTWNNASERVKSCVTQYQAKKEIKKFVRLLPI